MHLLSMPQLQAMFQMTQEGVSQGQLVKIPPADMPLVMQLLQRKQGPAGAQPGLGAAVHALQTLHQKLDIPDAAAVELDVDRLPRTLMSA